MTSFSPHRAARGYARPLALAVVIPVVACSAATSPPSLRHFGDGVRPIPRPTLMEISTSRAVESQMRLPTLASRDSSHTASATRAVDSTRSAKRGPGDRQEAGTDSGVPRVVPDRAPRKAGIVTFAFGDSDPVLSCTVLRACLVELQSGEQLVDEPIAGDQARWIITKARTGAGGASTLVIVKPKACDISTNLILSTDRRIYDLDLDSPACKSGGTNPKQQYTRHVRFEYPDDSARALASVAAAPDGEASSSPHASGSHESQSETSNTFMPDSAALNRDYRVARGRRGPFGIFGHKPLEFPWLPTMIADDGAHVYITLPPDAKRHAAPVLYAIENDGSRTMLNFTLRDGVIVTDRIFKRGLFVLAAGNSEQRLEFENRSWGRESKPARRP